MSHFLGACLHSLYDERKPTRSVVMASSIALFRGGQSMASPCSRAGAGDMRGTNILRKLPEALRDLVCVFLFDLLSSHLLVCSPSPATLCSFHFSESPMFVPTLGLFTFADPLT